MGSEKVETDQFGQCLEDMARLQELHNRDVHLSWASQGYPFYRAIWTECAELLEHYGWKWWKHHSTDLEQVKLEIVDIWHFGLSMILIEDRNLVDVALEISSLYENSEAADFRHSVEELAREALSGTFDLSRFVDVLIATPMTLGELYGIYKGKHVLNRFRQANGYKQGTYRKIWDGREDNIHLALLVRELDAYSEQFQDTLERALESRYLGHN